MTDPSVRAHRALGDASRSRILEELRAQGPLDSRELARLLRLHPNTIRSHADRLIQAGLVSTAVARSAARGRPRVLYTAASVSPDGHEAGYRLLAEMLAGCLATVERPRSVAESAGRAWGRYLAERPRPFSGVSVEQATEMTVELFGELGFMPEAVVDSGRTRLLLHRCPFREVAQANQEVVCSIHLGMLRGALQEMGAPLKATRLDPFVEPALCVAHLTRRPPSRGARSIPSSSGR